MHLAETSPLCPSSAPELVIFTAGSAQCPVSKSSPRASLLTGPQLPPGAHHGFHRARPRHPGAGEAPGHPACKLLICRSGPMTCRACQYTRPLHARHAGVRHGPLSLLTLPCRPPCTPHLQMVALGSVTVLDGQNLPVQTQSGGEAGCCRHSSGQAATGSPPGQTGTAPCVDPYMLTAAPCTL